MMMYANAQYYNYPSSNNSAGIRCDIGGVTSYVPIAPDNTDYANIMALVKDNKLTIAPASEEQK